MKKNKFIISLAGVVLSSLALVGCNENGKKTTTSASPSVTTTTKTPTTVVPTTTKTPTTVVPTIKPTTTVTTAGSTTTKVFEDVIHFYSYNEEFKGFFDEYISDEKKSGLKVYHYNGIKVKWTIAPLDQNNYQNALEKALSDENATSDKQIDMFVIEPNFMSSFVESDYTMSLNELGITDFSNSYDYITKLSTSSKNEVKAAYFYTCPSGIFYNRTIAEKVLGTDDPELVAPMLDTWDEFNALAPTLKDSYGCYITPSLDETIRAFEQGKATSWINESFEVVIPDSMKQWKDQTKYFYDNEYTINSDFWGVAKNQALYSEENLVFSVFAPVWYQFAIKNSHYGDWGFVPSPNAHYWGGSALMASKNTDNLEEVKEIMNMMFNDDEFASSLAGNQKIFTNNKRVNEKFAKDDTFQFPFFGNQNVFGYQHEISLDIDVTNSLLIDETICNFYTARYKSYVIGDSNDLGALHSFYSDVLGYYPFLKKPENL